MERFFATATVLGLINVFSVTASYGLHDNYGVMNEFMFENAITNDSFSGEEVVVNSTFSPEYGSVLENWKISPRAYSKKGFYSAFDSFGKEELKKAWIENVSEIGKRLKTCDATVNRIDSYSQGKFDVKKSYLEKTGRFVTPDNETLKDMFACKMKDGGHFAGTEIETISESYRITNITRALSLLDGKILQPGETLSVYSELFSGKADYVPGFGIKTVKGVTEAFKVDGGGVCGVSTAIYQASLKSSGMSIVERHPHSVFYSYYYGKNVGMDATIFGNGKRPSKDLKIRNDTGVPVVITTYVKPVSKGKFTYGANVFAYGLSKNAIKSVEKGKCGTQTVTSTDGKTKTVKSCYSSIER